MKRVDDYIVDFFNISLNNDLYNIIVDNNEHLSNRILVRCHNQISLKTNIAKLRINNYRNKDIFK